MCNQLILHRLLTSAMVDIYVGSDSTHWPLHERLLCYHSPFFSSIFYKESSNSRSGHNKSYGLPEEDDYPFELLVGWLYSRALRKPTEEKDIGPLLDLYLLADKFEMKKLSDDVVDTVRDFYYGTKTYPGLRRVQYVYSNTSEDNTMREMMVSSIARYLALGDTIPNHWAKALRRNGTLGVDIIRAIQEWHLEGRSVPDARDGSVDRGRSTKAATIGFSAIEDDRGMSAETGQTDDSFVSKESDVPEAALKKEGGEE